MYLSRLILNPQSDKVRRDMADCQSMHRTILSVFPPLPEGAVNPRQKYGILYRLEGRDDDSQVRLYVQSLVKPEWSKLPVSYCPPGLAIPNPACKSVERQYQELPKGLVLSFYLRANPTKRIKAVKAGEGGERIPSANGQRVPIRREDRCLSWLERKALAGGFELISLRGVENVCNLQTLPQRQICGIKSDKAGGKQRLTFEAVDFAGLLRICNADTFQATLRNGIGSGKAYGFGLLSVAPAGYR